MVLKCTTVQLRWAGDRDVDSCSRGSADSRSRSRDSFDATFLRSICEVSFSWSGDSPSLPSEGSVSDAYCYLRSARPSEHLQSAADQSTLRAIVDDYVSKIHLMCTPPWGPANGMMCMLSDLLGLSEENKGSMMILKSMHNCVAKVKDFTDLALVRDDVRFDQELGNSSVRVFAKL